MDFDGFWWARDRILGKMSQGFGGMELLTP